MVFDENMTYYCPECRDWMPKGNKCPKCGGQLYPSSGVQ